MNEKNIVSIDTVIDRIKICGYIDCNEHDGYYDEYEYDNILYYLEKYKNLQSKIDNAIDKLEKYGLVDKNSNFNAYLDTIELKELYDDLKEDK